MIRSFFLQLHTYSKHCWVALLSDVTWFRLNYYFFYYYYQELLRKIIKQSVFSRCGRWFLYLKVTDGMMRVYFPKLTSEQAVKWHDAFGLAEEYTSSLLVTLLCSVPYSERSSSMAKSSKSWRQLSSRRDARTRAYKCSCLWCHYILSQLSQTQLFLPSSKWCSNTSFFFF